MKTCNSCKHCSNKPLTTRCSLNNKYISPGFSVGPHGIPIEIAIPQPEWCPLKLHESEFKIEPKEAACQVQLNPRGQCKTIFPKLVEKWRELRKENTELPCNLFREKCKQHANEQHQTLNMLIEKACEKNNCRVEQLNLVVQGGVNYVYLNNDKILVLYPTAISIRNNTIHSETTYWMKMKTKTEVLQALALIGASTKVTKTGSPEWERIFIVVKGVTYGRISIHNGKLYNIKWYCGWQHTKVGDNEFVQARLNYMLYHGFLIDTNTWVTSVALAKAKQQADIKAKKQARAQLPQTRKNGKRITRSKITGKSIQSLIVFNIGENNV